MTTTPPRAARLLGAAGLAPFFASAAVIFAAPAGFLTVTAESALALYGALILSFMGGCRWGFRAVMSDGSDEGGDWRAYALSVVPSLWGFFALLSWITGVTHAGEVAAFLALGFAGLYASDVAATRDGAAPAWWPRLRGPLTLGAAGSLLVPLLVRLL